jgi:hypothetical protein
MSNHVVQICFSVSTKRMEFRNSFWWVIMVCCWWRFRQVQVILQVVKQDYNISTVQTTFLCHYLYSYQDVVVLFKKFSFDSGKQKNWESNSFIICLKVVSTLVRERERSQIILTRKNFIVNDYEYFSIKVFVLVYTCTCTCILILYRPAWEQVCCYMY